MGVKMKTQNKITKNTTLAEILEYPKASEILSKFNFPCLTCPMAALEISTLKIGVVAEKYNIDLDACLEELNKIIE